MKNKSCNPPKIGIKNGQRKTTLTAMSTCRLRHVHAPSTCRQHGRQRLLQETGHQSMFQHRDDRKYLGRKRINLAEICTFTNHILNSSKMTSSEVQQ